MLYPLHLFWTFCFPITPPACTSLIFRLPCFRYPPPSSSHHCFATRTPGHATASKQSYIIGCLVMYCATILCLCAMYTIISYIHASLKASSRGEGVIPNPIHEALWDITREAPGHKVVEPPQGLHHAGSHQPRLRPKQEVFLNNHHVKSPQGLCIHPFPTKDTFYSLPLSAGLYKVPSQQVAALREAVLHSILLNMHNAYDALDRSI